MITMLTACGGTQSFKRISSSLRQISDPPGMSINLASNDEDHVEVFGTTAVYDVGWRKGCRRKCKMSASVIENPGSSTHSSLE
jgi:hypothetical protein